MATPPDFSVGGILTAAQMDQIGLWLITSTSLGTGTTATLSCFSADYDAYRFVFNKLKSQSGTVFVSAQLRTGTTTSTTGYYGSRIEVDLSGTISSAGTNNGTAWTPPIVIDATNTAGGVLDVFDPFSAVQTSFTGGGIDARTTGAPWRSGGGFHSSATSYDQIVFTCSPGFTAQSTVSVYGYRKS